MKSLKDGVATGPAKFTSRRLSLGRSTEGGFLGMTTDSTIGENPLMNFITMTAGNVR